MEGSLYHGFVAHLLRLNYLAQHPRFPSACAHGFRSQLMVLAHGFSSSHLDLIILLEKHPFNALSSSFLHLQLMVQGD